MDGNSSRMSAVQIGIILTTFATALIHFSLLFPDVLFILNGLGYLTLLAAYFLPIDLARKNHNLIRWLFIAFTLVTILAWAVMGERSSLGYLTKFIEVVLVILLLVDRQPSQTTQSDPQ